MEFLVSNFKLILEIDGWGISCEIVFKWLSLDLRVTDEVIDSGNGLVLSSTKPLPEPMLTQIYATIWCR